MSSSGISVGAGPVTNRKEPTENKLGFFFLLTDILFVCYSFLFCFYGFLFANVCSLRLCFLTFFFVSSSCWFVSSYSCFVIILLLYFIILCF